VGINLLREGLDLPEVSLVAIFDADKEGFLRSERSLIQTFGRAARNVSGKVILYADTVTRRNKITPATIKNRIKDIMSSIYEADYYTVATAEEEAEQYLAPHEIPGRIKELRKEMKDAAKALDFERAAELRDSIKALEAREVMMG
jgi:excinuclease ABC subunit B